MVTITRRGTCWLVLALLPSVLSLVAGIAHAAEEAAAGAAAKATAASPAPVIVLVFDELPYSSLQDASGGVDGARYPAFARLEANGTSYIGITTVAGRILDAVPAILTGIRPVLQRKNPINADHPDNLFSLLAPTHGLHVKETYTLVQAPDAPPPLGKPDPQVAEIRRIRQDGRRSMNQPQQIKQFTRAMVVGITRAGAGARTFHFLHVMLPTLPWRFTATGTQYEPARFYGSKGDGWLDEPWWVEDAYRRHLLQLEYTDALLGELLGQLDARGLFEPSLIVVTASFGTAFWPGQSRLLPDLTEHPEDILHVPLFIKRPGQKKAEKDARAGETIDILPTIADLVGVSAGWKTDGCSLVSDTCPARTERVAMSYGGQRRLVHLPLDIVERRDTLDRKIALTGSGKDHSKFVRFGPYASLVGSPVSTYEVAIEAAGEVKQRRKGRSGGRAPRKMNPRITGQLVLEQPPTATPYVAVAADDVIASVVPAMHDRGKGRWVAALLPDDLLKGGRSDVALYLVTGDVEKPRLAPLRYVGPEKASIQKKNKQKQKPAPN